MIDRFREEYGFLSNFHILETPISLGNLEFITSEHLYQSFKTLLHEERMWIANQPTAREAKWAGSKKGYKGRKIQLRLDWDHDKVKLDTMFFTVFLKFTTNYNLAAQLMATSPKLLTEGNMWHDNYWGHCACDECANKIWHNHLGRTLMKVRDLLLTVRI